MADHPLSSSPAALPMTTVIIYVPPFKKVHRNDERYYFTLLAGLACGPRGDDPE